MKDVGLPLAPHCALRHELTGKVRQELCVYCSGCSSCSQPGCGLQHPELLPLPGSNSTLTWRFITEFSLNVNNKMLQLKEFSRKV